MRSDQEIINRWRVSAPFWEKHRNIIRGMFAPVTHALIEDAAIGNQDSVLDVATGPGDPALSVAALAGPNGKIFGVDAIQGTVAAARAEAQRLGLRNTKFDVAFADDLPIANDTFDAVISRFGVMFFPSPVDGSAKCCECSSPDVSWLWRFGTSSKKKLSTLRCHASWIAMLIRHYLTRKLPTHSDSRLVASYEAGAVAPSERLLQFKIARQPANSEQYQAS